VNYRKFGRTGLQISEVGYGAWGIGGKHWLGGRDDESLAALRRGMELGLNFIDTALAYGDGHSERLVGQVLGDGGREIMVATKVPPKNRLWPARPGIGIDEVFPGEYVLRCTETSLRNLGVERIDVQQLHVWNPEWLDRDEWRRAFEDLKRCGKVRAVGVSVNDHAPDSALGIISTGLVDSVQVIYNIFDQSPEVNLFPLCRERNIGVIARVPLDEGALAGRVNVDTTFAPGDFREYYFRGDHKREVAEHIAALRRDLGNADLPTTALRFCISHRDVSTVIPGMRSRQHVEANLGVSALGPLSADVIAVLRRHAWTKNFCE
jgi:aryl-alcohol dehydrogenase-like predicted oxidoreductase